jgi:DNA polymerase III delta prime subunit
MTKFRTRKTTQTAAESPALLFRDLRRTADVKFLWDHQGKLLDEYHQNQLNTPNVALELPTGAGKTLVGLLIAEYKRQTERARVVYLCPTRQLCHQVSAHANAYGIACSLLVGPQREYDIADFTSYQRANAVGITTYSGVFNTNPRISDPQVIICDDAHAADNYISDLWSLLIERRKFSTFFDSLLQFLGADIPLEIRRAMQSSEGKWDSSLIDLIPAAKYADRLDELSDLLDEHTRDTDLAYSWRMIRGRLQACNLYASGDSFLIKPIIPPTRTHAPFADARQRVFMSATLGEGGDLERITGLTGIARLPIPAGWEKRSTGRRLILFPNLLSSATEAQAFYDELIESPTRTLVLVRENRILPEFNQYEEKGVQILKASDIEDSLDAFTNSVGPTALVLANRYDGIDLPGDSCRRMMLVGLPAATDLQEKFLYQRLGAVSQLRDRIRTRITQGIGRCTRDENDFALVVLSGNDILKWCSTETNVAGMHPELQAEITFGLDNSTDRSLDDFRQLMTTFLNQDADWAVANSEIIERRNTSIKLRDSVTDALEKSVPHEIGFIYSIWGLEFERAFEEAVAATEALSGGNELRPYRAFWHYTAAVAAYYAWRQSSDERWRGRFTDEIGRALASSMGVPWLPGLQTAATSTGAAAVEPSIDVAEVSQLLQEWQIVGTRFERTLNKVREAINSDEAPKFERGLKSLGHMLGCTSKSFTEDGSPDGLWMFPDNKAVVFEAKTDENAANAIALKTVRQAGTHAEWVVGNGDVSEETNIITVVITHQTDINRDAYLVAGELRMVSVDDIRQLFARAATVLNSVRAAARSLSEEQLRQSIDEKFRAAGLTHKEILQLLSACLVSTLPVRGN